MARPPMIGLAIRCRCRQTAIWLPLVPMTTMVPESTQAMPGCLRGTTGRGPSWELTWTANPPTTTPAYRCRCRQTVLGSLLAPPEMTALAVPQAPQATYGCSSGTTGRGPS